MQHSDITVPTVTREKGKPLERWEERKRAARHQRNREDEKLRQLAERHEFDTLDAVTAAIFGGQR